MIAGCVLAFNEELNIVECLQTLRPHVDVLYLINMSSTDRTVQLARPYVDHVINHPNIPNFDGARNLVIDQCREGWIFFLDADERLPQRTGEIVRQLVRERGHEIVAITIPFLTQFCGKWIEHSGWWPGYTMPRVLKRGYFRFGEELHSGVKFNGPEFRLPPDPELAIKHYSYRSVKHYIDKFNGYTSTEAMNLLRNGQRLDWKLAIRAMVRDWQLYLERNEGYKDGFHGFVLSWFAGQYRLLSHLKLMDDPKTLESVPQLEFPQRVDDIIAVINHELGRVRAGRSREPFGIWFQSPLFDLSGYADEGRVFLKALSRTSRLIAAEEKRWGDSTCEIALADRVLLKALARIPLPVPSIKITNSIPTWVASDSAAEINILRTVFETDRIPDSWWPLLQGYDEIWVLCEHNRRSFIRGGVAPEKLRVVPAFIDTEVFCPDGPRLATPRELLGRQVFLSVFDWQWRKGWDVLLSAYVQEFRPDEQTGLLLKITRTNSIPMEAVREQADRVLRAVGQSLADRPDIVLWDAVLSQSDMASLYRSVFAFVLASRGEGWGRPYMEAMATGIPTIGTRGSGNEAFMTDDNSFLVDTRPVPVPSEASNEIPQYTGHTWREPDVDQLRQKLRCVVSDPLAAAEQGGRGAVDIGRSFSVEAGTKFLEGAINDLETRCRPIELPPVTTDQISVVLEGEFFAGHSFANINEQLVPLLTRDGTIGLSVFRRFHNPPQDEKCPNRVGIAPYIGRALPSDPQVTIRHAYPPNLDKPASGKWIHIQPWEFGYLPLSWIRPLRDDVDEIWVPSTYVKNVYVQSGIPEHKIVVMPWGVDTAVYNPDAVPLFIPTKATFRFLFVGGSILRKGIDVLFRAFLGEFKSDEDVCLVIKDAGTDTFYRYGNYRSQIAEVLAVSDRPEIVYFDRDMTDGQRASLYAACDCLVSPYRGEGFGLPVLEAMAVGLPVIVPRGGATDDFVNEELGILLEATIVETNHDERLVGPALELAVTSDELRKAMREAFSNRERTKELGRAARRRAESMTWSVTAGRMVERIQALVCADNSPTAGEPTATVAATAEPLAESPVDSGLPKSLDITICIVTRNDERTIADTIARAQPFAREVVVADIGSTDRTLRIASEYGCRLYPLVPEGDFSRIWNFALCRATSKWILKLHPGEWISQEDFEVLRTILEATNDNVHGYACSVDQAHSKPAVQDIRVLRNHKEIVFRNRLADDVISSIKQLAGIVFSAKVAVRRLANARAPMDDSERLATLHADLAVRPGHPWLLWCLGQAHFEMGNYFHAECYLSDCATGARSSEFPRNQVIGLLIETYMRIDDPYRAQEWRQRLDDEGRGAS